MNCNNFGDPLTLFKKEQCTLINMSTQVHHMNVPDLAIQANFHHYHQVKICPKFYFMTKYLHVFSAN